MHTRRFVSYLKNYAQIIIYGVLQSINVNNNIQCYFNFCFEKKLLISVQIVLYFLIHLLQFFLYMDFVSFIQYFLLILARRIYILMFFETFLTDSLKRCDHRQSLSNPSFLVAEPHHQSIKIL